MFFVHFFNRTIFILHYYSSNKFSTSIFCLKNDYSEYILSYSYISSTNLSYSSITIRILSSDDISLYTYIYDNYTKLLEDGNHFENYIKKSNILKEDSFF